MRALMYLCEALVLAGRPEPAGRGDFGEPLPDGMSDPLGDVPARKAPDGAAAATLLLTQRVPRPARRLARLF